MLVRNWIDLSRSLINRIDMNFSFEAVQQALGEYALAWFGEGVVNTSQYPNPFPVTMSGVLLGGSVGYGVGFDANGQNTGIFPFSLSSNSFTLQAADLLNPRFDLLCIEYLSTGDTPIPKPSDPLTTVDLNLHDDFQLVVVPGAPSATPTYPVKGNRLYIVLAGIQVPAGAGVGTQCTIDYTQREQANANLTQYPVVVQEIPSGVIDGVNTNFILSQAPVNAQSVIVKLDGIILKLGVDWSIMSQSLTLNPAPAIAQNVEVWYIVNSSNSQNPLAGIQEIPTPAPNGVNNLFNLTGKPANQASIIVFVDGLSVPLAGWSLIQGLIIDQIQFTVDYIPQTGQDVYVFYLANPFVFGVQPPQSSPVVSGGIVGYGSALSPQIISSAIGIPATSDQRQLWIIKSTGGGQYIIANPQIAPGTVIGQELYIQGASSTDYVILQDGSGVSLNGPEYATNNGSIYLIWNGINWYETSRR